MARKRKAASSSLNINTKRSKISATQPQDIVIIEDPYTNPKNTHEDKYAEQPQAIASGSKDVLQLDDVNEVDMELQEILAQIKAQEESERLAKQLQEEYDNLDTTHTGLDNKPSEIEISNVIPVPPSMEAASTSGAATQQTLQPIRKDDNVLARPDHSLEAFRDLFTGSRKCTNCGKQVKSPRGYVCSGLPFLSILTTSHRSSFPSLPFRLAWYLFCMLHVLPVLPIIVEGVFHPSVVLNHVKGCARIPIARSSNVAPKDVLSRFSSYWEDSTNNI